MNALKKNLLINSLCWSCELVKVTLLSNLVKYIEFQHILISFIHFFQILASINLSLIQSISSGYVFQLLINRSIQIENDLILDVQNVLINIRIKIIQQQILSVSEEIRILRYKYMDFFEYASFIHCFIASELNPGQENFKLKEEGIIKTFFSSLR